ncbi:MAG: nitrogen fixation protein NifH [Chloroflexi bacterium]|nr:nitrogen fixation protein NifH [Chloroflexota bacterium]
MAKSKTKESQIEWLLEPGDVGVRYLALRDLVGASSKDLAAARKKAHTQGPIAAVLAKMRKSGYWQQAGPGYRPKYTGTVWAVILLAQLGAQAGSDKRIDAACAYLLEHALSSAGQFTVDGAPSGTIDCLQGNLCSALLDLEYLDERLDLAFDWMARTVTGNGIAPLQDKDAPIRYYALKCGPGFACGANNQQSCAWGAVKVMLAFGKLPQNKWTAEIRRAIDAGIEFLLSRDPADADYPCGWGGRPSQNWWKFGFPVFAVTDLLQNVQALAALGLGRDKRLKNAVALVADKQDANGRWPLEYDYAGKTWIDVGAKRQPNKWVTYRALRALRLCQSTVSAPAQPAS